MVNKQIIAAAALSGLLLVGCDNRPESTAKRSSQSPATTVASAASDASPLATMAAHAEQAAPATQPSQTPHSTFAVNDGVAAVHFDFPRARLHLDREQKSAVLYSDDPKTAINRDYAGNSYYFVIPLSDEALEHLDGYQWHYKAASIEHQDSADGLFLQGQRYHVQPSEMVIAFQGDAPVVRVGLDGNFLRFDMSHSPQEGQMVRVQGIVNATVDAAK